MFALRIFTYSFLSSWIGALLRRRLRCALVIALPVGAGVSDLRPLLTIKIPLEATDRQLVPSIVPRAGLCSFVTPSHDRGLLRGAGMQASGLPDSIASRHPHPLKQR
jgi:hypothetical protein